MQHQHHPFDVGRISLLEVGDGLSIYDKLPILSLDCAFEFAMSRIILEHVDHVVEVTEGVIDGNNINFARVKSSPGNQVLNRPNPFTLTFTIMSQGCSLHYTGKSGWLLNVRRREPET